MPVLRASGPPPAVVSALSERGGQRCIACMRSRPTIAVAQSPTQARRGAACGTVEAPRPQRSRPVTWIQAPPAATLAPLLVSAGTSGHGCAAGRTRRSGTIYGPMHVRGNLTRVRLTNRGWSPTQEECHADQQWPHRRRAISDASALVIAPRARATCCSARAACARSPGFSHPGA